MAVSNELIAQDWREVFAHNGLERFEDFWELGSEWFEPPNQHRGGWSGAAKVSLARPGGNPGAVFIKKQENYRARTWRHPISGEPTLRREFDALRFFQAHQIPAPELLYFGCRRFQGKDQAILITGALEAHESLHAHVRRWTESGWPGLRQKHSILRCIAEVVRKMHRHRRQHNCLFPKHIFLHIDGGRIDVRLIDLEKTKFRPRSVSMYRDLGTLLNRSAEWSNTDRLRFLKHYLDVPGLTAREKRIWRNLARKSKL